MYDVSMPRRVHVNPWVVARHERLRMFHRRTRKVAYYGDTPNDSSFRYRVYSMAAAINGADLDVSASWFYRSDGRSLLEQVFAEADVVVVHRSEYTAELDHLIGIARRRGVPVLFDCDDLVFDPAAVPLILHTLAQPMSHLERGPDLWDVWYALITRHWAVARLCDGFIATTDALAAEARAVLGLPTSVVPNFMTEEEFTYAEDVLAARSSGSRSRGDSLHVGYFSGSFTHVNDIAIAGEALRAVLNRHPHVVVRIAGHMTVAQAGLKGFEQRVEAVPFTDYVNLHRVIAETEINIAPLQDNRFTRCKSELKWFDAGLVGIPTLASPTESMRAAVDDGVDGLLVPDHLWQESLEEIIEDYDGLGRRIGEAARATALAKYRPQAVVPQILSALSL